MSRLNKDVLAGTLFVLLGLFFLVQSYHLSFGTWRRVGPGAFPAIVAALMLLTGLGITLKGLLRRSERIHLFAEPRGLVAVLAALVIFGLTIRGAGFVPAVLLSTLASAFAMRPVRLVSMAIYGILAGIIGSVIFIVLLGMPVPIIGPWFGF